MYFEALDEAIKLLRLAMYHCELTHITSANRYFHCEIYFF